MTVVETGTDAETLAKLIIEKHSDKKFTFFCGNLRRDTLPYLLKKAQIPVIEVEVYKTTLNPKKFDQQFDAVLFFSPSGVESFFSKNKPFRSQSPPSGDLGGLICIGSTTANAAKEYSDNVHIANSTTVESVIAKAVKVITR